MSARYVLGLGMAVMLASCQGEPLMSAMPETVESEQSPMSANNKRYVSEHWGVAFEYPDGFVVDESEIDRGTIELWTQEDYAKIQQNEFAGSELPANVGVAVRENPVNLPLRDWVEQDNWFVNPTDFQAIAIAGREGLMFRGTGLYENQYVVVAEGDRVLVVSFAASTAYEAAFEQVLETMRLTQSK
jgi:hypothetical protein